MVKYTALKKAAIRIAEQVPWTGSIAATRLHCGICGRQALIESRMGQPDRKAHEPDCQWIALREALGMEVIE